MTRGFGLIGDDQHAAVEGALLVVERDEFLAINGAADNDLASGDLFRVEDMQGLAQLEHHEVAQDRKSVV